MTEVEGNQGADKEVPGQTDATENDKPIKKRKRRYTHSRYVCDKCRKSHRRCLHSFPERELAVHLTGAIAEDTLIERIEGSKHELILARLSLIRRNVSGISWTSIKFYISHAVYLFADTKHGGPATDFWRITVPQMVDGDLFLQDALIGLTYLFKDCPRPAGLTNAQVMSLVQKTFQRVQQLLKTPQQLVIRDLVDLFLGTSILAIATFLGVGSLAALRVHLDGLRAITENFYNDIVLQTSPLRQYFLGYRQPRNSLKSQRPLDLRHLHYFEAILRCVPMEELLADEYHDGSMIHLLILTNRTIHLEEEQSTQVSDKCSINHKSFAIFRELCEGRLYYQKTRESLRSYASSQARSEAEAIRAVFEQALFVFHKQLTVACVHQHSGSDLQDDYLHLKDCITHAKTLRPSSDFSWPESVYSRLPVIEVEQDETMLQHWDQVVRKVRDTMKWTIDDFF